MRAPVDVLVDAAVDAVRDSQLAEATARMATVSAVQSGGTVTVDVPGGSFPGVRLLSSYYAPVVGDVVEILRTAGGWVCLGRLAASSAPTIQSGRTSALSASPGEWNNTPVSFPRAFAVTPRVVATPSSGIGATTDLKAIVTSESATGFTMRVWRGNDTTPTNVNWIATTL